MATDIIVHPDPKRDAKAAELANQVESWPRIILKIDHGSIPAGTVARRAPASKGNQTYKVCALACTCPDYADWGNVCKHVRAIRIWESRQQRPHPIASGSRSVEQAEAHIGILQAKLAERRRRLALCGWETAELYEDGEYSRLAEQLERVKATLQEVAV